MSQYTNSPQPRPIASLSDRFLNDEFQRHSKRLQYLIDTIPAFNALEPWIERAESLGASINLAFRGWAYLVDKVPVVTLDSTNNNYLYAALIGLGFIESMRSDIDMARTSVVLFAPDRTVGVDLHITIGFHVPPVVAATQLPPTTSSAVTQ